MNQEEVLEVLHYSWDGSEFRNEAMFVISHVNAGYHAFFAGCYREDMWTEGMRQGWDEADAVVEYDSEVNKAEWWQRVWGWMQ